VRWHARVCRVTALIHPLSSSPPRHRCMDKTPSASPPRQSAAAVASLLRPATRMSTPALPPRRAVTCLSLSLHSLRCFYATRGYKRSPPLHLILNRAVSASGKLSPPHCLCFLPLHQCQAASPPPLSPCTDPGVPQGSGATPRPVQVTPSPLLSSGAIDCAGEPLLPRRPPS
jgi:hypothetical protein